MKIKTDYLYCSYITPGKEYEVKSFSEAGNYIIEDDTGHRIIALLSEEGGCAHLQGLGRWEEVE